MTLTLGLGDLNMRMVEGGWGISTVRVQGGLLLGRARGQNTGGGEEMGEIIHENVNILF